MKPLLVYDCEIIKAIPNRDGSKEPGIAYCDGWRDFANMGISVIGAYDYADSRYRVFLSDNFDEFSALLPDRCAVAFNGRAFDDQLIAAHGMEVGTTYDPLVEIWAGARLGPTFNFKTHGGYGLDAVCQTNFGLSKTGNGALAPILWQQGKYGAVIDYCLNDVTIERRLMDHIIEHGAIKCPKTGDVLKVRRPYEEAPE